MKGGGAIIGYVLGMTIVIPLILYIISLIFYAPNKVTEAIISQYIKDSKTIMESIEGISFKEFLDSDLNIGGVKTKTITLYLARNNTGTRDYYCYGFYSKKYNKYFRLMTFVEGMGVFPSVNDGDKENILITVNEEELNNPAYGTLKKPVPILKFTGVDASLRTDNKDYDQAYMDTVYRNNVEMYLKYLMPKKEFKERFGK
jgi:hypothetical protein